jgi:hypothetical protein
LSGGGSCSLLLSKPESLEDATGLSRGGFTINAGVLSFLDIAKNVKLHRARRWHHQNYLKPVSSNEHEPPPDKPVASQRFSPSVFSFGITLVDQYIRTTQPVADLAKTLD